MDEGEELLLIDPKPLLMPLKLPMLPLLLLLLLLLLLPLLLLLLLPLAAAVAFVIAVLIDAMASTSDTAVATLTCSSFIKSDCRRSNEMSSKTLPVPPKGVELLYCGSLFPLLRGEK